MSTQTLNQILNIEAADGPFTKQDSVLQQTLRDFIQLQSLTLTVGVNIVGVRTVPWITYKFYTGALGSFSFPLDDNAVVDPTNVGTESYTAQLYKGQGRTVFLDSVRLRGESFETLDRQQLAIVRRRAEVIDNKILTDCIAGAGQTKAATAVFSSGSADPEQDILDAMDLIFANGRVSGNEAQSLVLPATVRSILLNTSLYGNVIESLQEHLGRIADLNIWYSRDYGSGSALTTSALLMVPGAETAEFLQYNGPGYQETEITRIEGVGYSYLLTSYFGTVIHEMQDGASSGTNNRICKITGVIS